MSATATLERRAQGMDMGDVLGPEAFGIAERTERIFSTRPSAIAVDFPGFEDIVTPEDLGLSDDFA